MRLRIFRPFIAICLTIQLAACARVPLTENTNMKSPESSNSRAAASVLNMANILYVTAEFHAKRDKLNETRSFLAQLQTDIMKEEPGCISYIFVQSKDDETLFTSFEVWKNSEAEAAHWQTPHTKAASARLPSLLDGGATVRKWQAITAAEAD